MNFIMFLNAVLMKILETHVFLGIARLFSSSNNKNINKLASYVFKAFVYFGILTRICNRRISNLIIVKYCSNVDRI